MTDPAVRSKAYGGYRAGHPFYSLMRQPLLVIVSHWFFQGMLNMDPAERWFKLSLDVVVTTFLAKLTCLGRNRQSAIVMAWLTAHSLNFFFNAHLWGALKHFGHVETRPEVFSHYQKRLTVRIQDEPSILYAAAHGSLSRGAWTVTSDLDVTLLRAKGIGMALRASLFALTERSKACFARFPLDLYVRDDWESLARTQPAESIVLKSILAER